LEKRPILESWADPLHSLLSGLNFDRRLAIYKLMQAAKNTGLDQSVTLEDAIVAAQ
uniref:AAA family ATPase n=1 Tax=Schistocephalus solidus TaxID=70667 RepID=A0A183TAJ1_SCHSO